MATTFELNPNEIFAPLFNQIISQEVFSDNLAGGVGSELVDMARVDGSMYGDTKLYYATKPLYSTAWGNDTEADKLTKLARPEAPETQAIYLNKFRQIKLTTDEYMTYIGTATSPKQSENIPVKVTEAVGSATGEEAARLEGAAIGEAVANLIVNLKDISEDYNDYGILRSYNPEDLIFVWNSEAMSRVEARDLPTIYHKDIIDKFGEYVLPARYFGTVNSGATKGATGVRSLIEQTLTGTDSKEYHVFAGQLIPTVCTAPAGTSYTVDSSILFKVFHKKSVPYMSAFEVGTSFFNAGSLTNTNFLTWGHNTLTYLKNYPCITVKKA